MGSLNPNYEPKLHSPYKLGANDGPRPGQAINPGGFDWDELPAPEPWVADAVCASTFADEFFPEKGGNPDVAKRICRSCPVQDECLKYALDNDEKWGIWGATSPRERRRMKRGLPPKVNRKPNGHGFNCHCCRSVA